MKNILNPNQINSDIDKFQSMSSPIQNLDIHQNQPFYLTENKLSFAVQNPSYFQEDCSKQQMQEDQGAIKWSEAQNFTLFEKFTKLGSKWIEICRFIKGKTYNCIKNRFYGSLRKSIRGINKVLKENAGKFKKELKYESVIRILNASQGFLGLNSPLKETSEIIRTHILDLAMRCDENILFQEANYLMAHINSFNMATRSHRNKRKLKNGIKVTQQENVVTQGLTQVTICDPKTTSACSEYMPSTMTGPFFPVSVVQISRYQKFEIYPEQKKNKILQINQEKPQIFDLQNRLEKILQPCDQMEME